MRCGEFLISYLYSYGVCGVGVGYCYLLWCGFVVERLLDIYLVGDFDFYVIVLSLGSCCVILDVVFRERVSGNYFCFFCCIVFCVV